MLDSFGGCLLHRLRLFRSIEDMGGLHIIGTERHESRRIDNQLRGRAGRQGDKGSSRFFLSLEDDLMKMFAGKTTLTLLSKLGMKEGDAIEHPMLTRAVEKAQRKVEERNFQIRKNILEYDEPMEYQRRSFYGTRQRVLEGRDIKGLIFEQIRDAVRDAAATYLDPMHRANCVVEWVRENLGVGVDPGRLRKKDREDMQHLVLTDAREEATQTIRVTVGEYVFDGAEPEEWDAKGLSEWAAKAWGAELSPEQIRTMERRDICTAIEKAAERKLATVDLAPLDVYLAPLYSQRELAEWANRKFGGEFKAEMFEGIEDPAKAVDRLLEHAREVYRKREIAYPIEFAIEMTAAGMQQNPQMALQQFCAWVKSRYGLDWNPAALPSTNPVELRNRLIAEAEGLDDAKLNARADAALAEGSDPEALDKWFQENCLVRLTDAEKEEAGKDPKPFVQRRLRELMRTELTQFERWVLLQILDTAWKDHLYAMDQIRDSIGFRAFSQRDPRIEFKKEASRLFEEMYDSIRGKVTDVIFKGRLMPQAPRPQAGTQPEGQPPVQSQGQPAAQGGAPAPVGAPTGQPAPGTGGVLPSAAPGP
ncbi:MAG: hypothetical protein KDC98_19840 [Planctomycetes bacterium]|nr:hypothetical protein [Planctomycetota bacterium]